MKIPKVQSWRYCHFMNKTILVLLVFVLLAGCFANKPKPKIYIEECLTDKIRNLEMENAALRGANEFLIKENKKIKYL